MSQKVNARNSYCDKGHLPPKPRFTLAFMLVHLSGTGEFWHISPVLLDCRSCSSPHPRRWVSILPDTKMGQESWCAEIHLEKNPAFKVRRKTFDQRLINRPQGPVQISRVTMPSRFIASVVTCSCAAVGMALVGLSMFKVSLRILKEPLLYDSLKYNSCTLTCTYPSPRNLLRL